MILVDANIFCDCATRRKNWDTSSIILFKVQNGLHKGFSAVAPFYGQIGHKSSGMKLSEWVKKRGCSCERKNTFAPLYGEVLNNNKLYKEVGKKELSSNQPHTLHGYGNPPLNCS